MAILRGEKVVLRPKCLEDAVNDYLWATDRELAEYDATVPLNLSYEDYLAKYKQELVFLTSTRRRLAIETLEGKHIGNCSYYLSPGLSLEAELGILMGERDYWGKGYGSDAVITLLCFLFEEERVTRVYLYTLDWNTRAQRCFAKAGFTLCGRLSRDGRNMVIMEVHQRDFQNKRPAEKQRKGKA